MKHALGYWIFQLAGAAVAALIALYVFKVEGGAHCLPDDGTTKAIGAELLGTFALAYVVLNVTTSKETSGNSFYGLAIGGTILAMWFALGNFSGAVYNPAVAVGLCIQKTFCWDNILIYVFSTLGGGAVAALVFSLINPDDK